MFSRTLLGPGSKGLVFEPHAQFCWSLAFLLSTIGDKYFEPQVPPNPLFELDILRYSLVRLSVESRTKLISVVSCYCIFAYITCSVRLNLQLCKA